MDIVGISIQFYMLILRWCNFQFYFTSGSHNKRGRVGHHTASNKAPYSTALTSDPHRPAFGPYMKDLRYNYVSSPFTWSRSDPTCYRLYFGTSWSLGSRSSLNGPNLVEIISTYWISSDTKLKTPTWIYNKQRFDIKWVYVWASLWSRMYKYLMFRHNNWNMLYLQHFQAY